MCDHFVGSTETPRGCETHLAADELPEVQAGLVLAVQLQDQALCDLLLARTQARVPALSQGRIGHVRKIHT